MVGYGPGSVDGEDSFTRSKQIDPLSPEIPQAINPGGAVYDHDDWVDQWPIYEFGKHDRGNSLFADPGAGHPLRPDYNRQLS